MKVCLKFIFFLYSIGCLMDSFGQQDLCEVKLQFITESGEIPQDRIAFYFSNKQEEKFVFGPDGTITIQQIDAPNLITVSYQDTVQIFSFSPEDCGKQKTLVVKDTNHQLNEVRINAFRNEKNRDVVPATIGLVSNEQIELTDQYSLQNTINTIPGVIMESRGMGGSHRINIRGSALRSPFAVRNIKMYVEGIPITSPDGQAPFEMIDASDIQQIEVIKGPSGSVYGSGNGGVLLYQLKKATPQKTSVGGGVQAGSFGGYRSFEFAELGTKNGGFRISHVWQDHQGYRDQEFNRKNQVSLLFNQFISEKQKITFYGTYYSGKWGLPGALSAKQVTEDPTQAVPFSVTNNAFLQRDRLFGGVSHRIKFSPNFSETTSFYYYSTGKLNPYGTSAFNSGHKDEGADGYGGRTDWSFFSAFQEQKIKLNFGGEWQTEKFNIIEKSISNSQPDEFKYLYDIGYISTMAFASVNYELKNILFVDLGASYNRTNQDVRGFNNNNFSFDTTATWTGTFLPRIATSIALSPQFTFFHSISAGNANPTVFEMIDYENNAYNLQLKPESGISHEIGIKHRMKEIGVYFELSYYEFRLNDAILAYTVNDGNDARNFYHNAGETNQRGMEWSFEWNETFLNDLLELQFTSTGSIFSYRYKRYEIGDTQLAGKHVAGVPLTNASHGLHLLFLQQVKLSIQDFWFDRTPLNNANTVWSAPYHLLNLRLGWEKVISSQWQLGVHAGINNLLDSAYTSNFNLNAVGDKYYNPSTPLNWFTGLNIRYTLRNPAE